MLTHQIIIFPFDITVCVCVMGCEAEAEQQNSSSSIIPPRLPLFSVPTIQTQMQSPERPGMLTPPLQTSASVPFRWEQQPGKPRLCNALMTFSNPTLDKCCLELPPRLLVPSNYVARNRFKSPSFRMSNRYNCYGSSSGSSSSSGYSGLLGAMVLIKESGWFCSWRKKAFFKGKKRDVTGGSHVFPSSSTDNHNHNHNRESVTHNKMMKRSGSSTSLSHAKSRVWTTIREGMKQVVPWRSKKLKKVGSGLKL